jgi:hypothetical protein
MVHVEVTRDTLTDQIWNFSYDFRKRTPEEWTRVAKTTTTTKKQQKANIIRY